MDFIKDIWSRNGSWLLREILYGKRAGLLSCRDKPIWPFGEVRREKRLVFLHCVFKCTLNRLPEWMQSPTTFVFSPECAVMVFYVLSQNVVRYHISTTQISNKMCWNYFSPECGVVLFQMCIYFHNIIFLLKVNQCKSICDLNESIVCSNSDQHQSIYLFPHSYLLCLALCFFMWIFRELENVQE